MTMPPIDLPMKEDRRAVARERHGLFRRGAFAAARVRRPSIQNIRERHSDHVKERTSDIELPSCAIEVLACEAISRDLDIARLIGQILAAAINKDMIQKILR
jgi:hypothetical protein